MANCGSTWGPLRRAKLNGPGVFLTRDKRDNFKAVTDALAQSAASTKDLTKQAHIDAAVGDTLAGVFNCLRSAAIAHKVRICAPVTPIQFNFTPGTKVPGTR
jgi:hypothetical protein